MNSDKHVISTLRTLSNDEPDVVVMVQEISPLRIVSKKLRNASVELFEIYIGNESQSLLHVSFWEHSSVFFARCIFKGDFLYIKKLKISSRNYQENICFIGSVDRSDVYILKHSNGVYNYDIVRYPHLYSRVASLEVYFLNSSFSLLIKCGGISCFIFCKIDSIFILNKQ
jgi:hypothetical protein